MRNLKVKMAYNGAFYHGYQRQNNAVTIQQTVEEALSKLLMEEITINGCSRTDAGVHAREYVFNFKTDNPIRCEGLVTGTNNLLPKDIAIIEVSQADEDFHARFDCKGKEYEYVIHNSAFKNPFYANTAMRYKYPLDEKILDSEAKAFIGKYDFKAFCSADCDKEDTTRTIYSFDVVRENDLVKMRVSGDGFLYNMVRIMVGTLIYLNEGKIEKGKIKEIIKNKDRTKAGITVVPDGLYLNKVFY